VEIALVKQDLEMLEGVIKKNLAAFYEVGRALMEIRDRRLYKEVKGYKTFEEYCRIEWNFSRSRAYQLIDSAEAVENVNNCRQIPTTESQTRPLTQLKPDQQAEAWQEAVETAPNGKVTAAHVALVVEKTVAEQTGGQAKDPIAYPVSDAKDYVRFAISQLERIMDDDPEAWKELGKLILWIDKRRRELCSLQN